MKAANGSTVHIVPGVLQAGAMPNVMRGEETQIFGALASDAALDNEPHGALIGLPGTHAKWAFVFKGRIERFYTFMTGETFARTARSHDPRPHDARDRAAGYRTRSCAASIPRKDAGHAGMLATIFSTRTLGLTGQLAPEQQSDYLSGLADRPRIARPERSARSRAIESSRARRCA